jgi:hypothetical protein
MSKTYEIVVKQILHEEDLDDLVDAAINACSYWCSLMEYGKQPKDCQFMSQALSHGGTLVFHIDEPFVKGGATSFELTTDKLIKGIQSYGGLDVENYDGGIADDILQRALFGEVVYG